MVREGNKNMWYCITRYQNDPHSPAPTVVNLMVNGMAEDSTIKEDTEQFIFEETEQRFQLEANAPIETTKLMKQLGYLSNSEIAEQILNGTFITPSDLDDATALVLEYIGHIGMQVRNGETIVTISADKFYYFWKRVKEVTASSYSGIHYGHYKAEAHSELLLHFLS